MTDTLIYDYVLARINHLESIAETGKGKAALAELRRGVGKQPGEMPELWWVVFDKLPETLKGKVKPSSAEWAIYTALTLYALHRQGGDKIAHSNDHSFGVAAATLVKAKDNLESILDKVEQVITAHSTEDLAYYLKNMVQLFRKEKIRLNYADLAQDLYIFSDPKRSVEIKRKWGQDFYSHL